MKYRNPLIVLLLSIVTLGIYDLYWLVKVKTVLNNKTKIHTPTIWLLFAPIAALIGIIIVYVIIAHPAASSTTTVTYGQMTTTKTANAGFALFLLFLEFVSFIVIVPVTFYWFFQFSKAINEYTKEEMNTGVAFLLLWLLHFIGVIIVQDKFNDMLQAGRISSYDTPSPQPTPGDLTPFQLSQIQAEAPPPPPPATVQSPAQPSAPTAADTQVPAPTDSRPNRTSAPSAQEYHAKSMHQKHHDSK